jgi:ubiquinone/menaquinone biosynthesis C-methylase UbiE
VSEYSYQGSNLLRMGEQLRNYNAFVAENVAKEAPPGASVLDFGAGFGVLTRAVAPLIGKPDCVEPDATQRAALSGDGFRCFNDIAAVRDESYGYVYSSNVLEHIQDDLAALRELRRVLLPGGRLMLYVPAFQQLYTAMDEAVGHYRRYDTATISDRLKRAGFRVDRTRYADFFGYGVTLLYKRVSNRVSGISERRLRLYDSLLFPITRTIERIIAPPFGKNVIAVATRIEVGA